MTVVRRVFVMLAGFLASAAALPILCAGLAQAVQVKIATEGTYKPFSFFTAGGELTGFDVELSLAICKAAGLDCVMVTMDNDSTVPALNDKKIDAISTGMSITEKRKKVVAFTDPIRSSGKQFVSCTPDKFPDVSPEALKGHIIGTQSSTASADFIKGRYAGSDVRLYKSMDEAFQDLTAGRLDLALAQMAVAYDFMHSPAGAGCKFVGQRLEDAKYFGDGVGIALRKDDADLKAALDGGLRKVIDDGTYKAINDKYFPFSLR